MHRVTLPRLIPLLAAPWLLPLNGVADNRIMVPATINGQSGQLAFDTGAGIGFTVVRGAVEKFGLKLAPPSDTASSEVRPGNIPLILTHPATIELFGQTIERRFAVVDTPPGVFPDFDGLLGWPAVRTNNWLLELAANIVRPLPELPGEILAWSKFRLRSEYEKLVLELPAEEDEPPALLVIDTGSQAGVALPPTRWHAWRAAHRRAPASIAAYVIPGSGLTVSEEAWADTLTLNQLILHGVPVNEGTLSERTLNGEDVGAISIGFAALRRLDLAIDAENDFAYARVRNDPPQPYAHNRLGAVFVPAGESTNDLVARVLPSGPANRATIRDGDVLLKINDQDITNWRTNPRIQFSQIFGLPAGTRLRLTLRRGEQTMVKSVVLQDLIGPSTPKKKVTGSGE